MALLVYKEGLNMVMLGQVLGRRMIDVCRAADETNRMDDTIDKGFGFGNRVYEIVHHLESTKVVLLGPHNMVEQQAMACPRRWKNSTRSSRNLAHATAHNDASGDTRHGLQVRAGPC